MEPTGSPRVPGIVKPLMLETDKLDTLPVNEPMLFVEIVLVEMATAVVTVVERLMVEIEKVLKVLVVKVVVVKELMLPVRELNWKQPILLAVVVRVDR